MDFRLVWSDQLSNLVILVYNLEKLVFFKTLRFYMKPFILSHFQSKVGIKLLKISKHPNSWLFLASFWT